MRNERLSTLADTTDAGGETPAPAPADTTGSAGSFFDTIAAIINAVLAFFRAATDAARALTSAEQAVSDAVSSAANAVSDTAANVSAGAAKARAVIGATELTPRIAPAIADQTKEIAPGVSPKISPYVKRHRITIPETITATFYSKGSSAWANQPCGDGTFGCHLGTDYGAPRGSAVYAAYDMVVTKVDHYEDEGRFGYFVMGSLGDGNEYYSGHLQNVKVAKGDFVKGGQQIGETNYLNHTHIQLRIAGQLSDFQAYIKANP